MDGAGKTTILYRFSLGESVTTIPTIGFNIETVKEKNLTLQVWDLGGQQSVRPYWRCYYATTKAIIYVIDSSDKERIELSVEELKQMLEEEELQDAVLLVLANKNDVEGALSSAQISELLQLTALKDRDWQIYSTCATQNKGIEF